MGYGWWRDSLCRLGGEYQCSVARSKSWAPLIPLFISPSLLFFILSLTRSLLPYSEFFLLSSPLFHPFLLPCSVFPPSHSPLSTLLNSIRPLLWSHLSSFTVSESLLFCLLISWVRNDPRLYNEPFSLHVRNVHSMAQLSLNSQ